MKWGDEKNQERERHKVLGSGQFVTRSSWVLIITPVPAPGAAPSPATLPAQLAGASSALSALAALPTAVVRSLQAACA